jgi:hypothetical protein
VNIYDILHLFLSFFISHFFFRLLLLPPLPEILSKLSVVAMCVGTPLLPPTPPPSSPPLILLNHHQKQ